jgi:hypothetical protein
MEDLKRLRERIIKSNKLILSCKELNAELQITSDDLKTLQSKNQWLQN